MSALLLRPDRQGFKRRGFKLCDRQRSIGLACSVHTFLLMVAEDIMTQAPTSVGPSERIDRIEGLLLELDVRHLPVVDEGQLIGIISDRDVAPFRLDPGRSNSATTASEIMSSNVVSVSPETELSEVIATLIDEKVGALPVVEPASRSLVGIISYVDLLRSTQNAY